MCFLLFVYYVIFKKKNVNLMYPTLGLGEHFEVRPPGPTGFLTPVPRRELANMAPNKNVEITMKVNAFNILFWEWILSIFEAKSEIRKWEKFG